MNTNYDASYKALFSHPEMVRDLIVGFVPDDGLHQLDWSSLERINSSYVSEDLRQRASDVVWRVQAADGWLYIYLLIEFQSSIDQYMALRMMVYQGLLYQDLIKQGKLLGNGQLPPLLPIVLYNGTRVWRAATDVAMLIPSVRGKLGAFKPQVRYWLLDVNAHANIAPQRTHNLVAALLALEQSRSPDEVKHVTGLLVDWLHDNASLRQAFSAWICANLLQNTDSRIVSIHLNDLQEVNTMLAERAKLWEQERLQQFERDRQEVRRQAAEDVRREFAEEVRREFAEEVRREIAEEVRQEIAEEVRREIAEEVRRGLAKEIAAQLLKEVSDKAMQQGIHRGKDDERQAEAADMLLLLLQERFGELPVTVVMQIQQTSVDVLEIWFRQAIKASSLAESLALQR